MNNIKVYTAPSAEMLLLVPVETLAASEWGFGKWNGGTWHSGTFKDTASGVGIVNGGLGTSAWAEDGYTLNKSS